MGQRDRNVNSKELRMKKFNLLLNIISNETEDYKLLSSNNGDNSFQIKNPYIPIRVLDALPNVTIKSFSSLEALGLEEVT